MLTSKPESRMLDGPDGLIPIKSIAEHPYSPIDYYPQTPSIFTFEITSRCNQSCPGCGNGGQFSHSAPFLSASHWIEIFDRVRPHARYVRITGGECTTHPGFQAILRHLDTFGIPFSIFTNGVWRMPDGLVTFLCSLKNLSTLLVSLHGPDADTHRSFSGAGYFEKVIANVRLAVRAGLTVDTNTVFGPDNWDKVADIVRLSAELGARCAVFSRYYGAELPGGDLPELQLRHAIQTVETLRAQGHSVKLNPCIPECFTASTSGGCGAGLTLCTVDPMGNVRPCNHAPLWMGNLAVEDIQAIWSSQAAQDWRNMLPTACHSCSALSRCGGGCRATAMHRRLNSDPLVRGPLPPEPPKVKRLFAGYRPVPHFTIRHEQEGALLMRYTHVVPVSCRGLEVVEAMNGQNNLAKLQARFGSEAIELSYELYLQDLIDLEE